MAFSRTLSVLLVAVILGSAIPALAAPPQQVMRVRGAGPTFKQGNYPNEVGSARLFAYTAYDFFDQTAVFGQVTGKCDVFSVFSGGYVESCQYSFDFDAGQIMVIGNVHSDYRPESFLAVVGGTRSFREVTGQMQRRVIAADKRIFPSADSENEYIISLTQ